MGRIERQAASAPDRLAYVRGDRALSYAELIRGASSMAAWLGRHQEHKQGPVVIYGHKEPEMLVGMLGALKAGRAYVPIDVAMPRSRLERIIEVSRAQVVWSPDQIATLDGHATAA